MPSAVDRVVGELRRVDRAQLAPRTALRCAVGVVLPLVIGQVVGYPADSVAAAAGALSVGIASFQGVYRTRATAMAITSVGMAVSTFVGAVTSHQDWLAIPITGLWGFVAGLLVAVGPAATVVGLQWTVALIVVTQFPMGPGDALVRAGLVLAGGGMQTLLVVTFWPLRTHRPERRALAAGYRALAAYARRVPAGGPALPETDSLASAARILADPNPLSRDRTRVRFRALLDEAERIRIELAALAEARRRLPGASAALAELDELFATTAGVLDSVADTVEPPHRLARPGAPDRAAEPAAELPEHAPPHVLAAGRPLRGQLRSAVRIARRIDADENALTAETTAPRPPGTPARRPAIPIRGPLLTIRANLDLGSEPCRHAIRLAVALAVASAVYRVLPVQRGYWTALTVLVVLKPDFAATVSRGLGRILGTALGAVLATVIAAELTPGPLALVVLVGVLAFATYAVFRVNYTAFAVCLTGLVVFLLALIGLPPDTAIVDRLVDTVAGGTLALLAYALWPTWEGPVVRGKLAALLEAQNRYGSSVLAAYADPAARDPALLRDALVAARLARSNAQASVDRLLSEPARYRLPPGVATGVVAAVQRYAQSALTLHAHVPEAADPALPQLRPLADQLDCALRQLAAALRDEHAPAALPPLRDTQLALAEVLDTGQVTGHVAVAETDAMVDAVDTVAHLLGRPR